MINNELMKVYEINNQVGAVELQKNFYYFCYFVGYLVLHRNLVSDFKLAANHYFFHKCV